MLIHDGDSFQFRNLARASSARSLQSGVFIARILSLSGESQVVYESEGPSKVH